MGRKVKVFSLFLVFALTAGFVFAGGAKEEKSAAPEKKVIRIQGAFVEPEASRFEECLKAFEERTGIDVIYEGSKEFETQILVQAEAGTPPDMAALPQPGLMRNFAKRGFLTPLSPEVVKRIDENYSPSWKELGSYNGKVYGVFHRVNAKSFVWYPKKAFEAAGYKIPKTWDELIALSNQIVADGGVPWSIGIESGSATGWVATDWMEDIMLRTAGPEMYDKWVAHEIPFNDPSVKKAAEIMASIWLNPKYTLGGPSNILTTNFGDAVKPLFDHPPKAWLHRQGNFITGFMPESVQANLDEEVGVFAFPEINPKWGTPVLGGGDQFVAFNDRPEVMELMAYLTTWESAAPWARAGGALFPFKDTNYDDYSSKIDRSLAKILVNAKVFRFDGSDNMPAEVGAGTFWTGMTDLVGGVPIDKVLKQIDDSWPKQ